MTLSSFLVDQNAFQGPFDILCQLVEKGELAIDKISISEITQKFLHHVLTNEKVDMDSASEFLFLCAGLIERKSKRILPQEEKAILPEDEINPADLLDRVAQYRNFKTVALSLKERKAIFEKVYARYGKIYEEAKVGTQRVVLKDLSLTDLVSAFKKLWDEVSSRDEIREIISEELRVEDRIQEIVDLLNQKSPRPFRELFFRMTKAEIMVTFLAMLDLIKAATIAARQTERFGEIMIYKIEENPAEARPETNPEHGT